MGQKPLGINWESWVDRRIREAQERGDFDNVPKGRIKGLDRPYSADWWLRDWVKRENISLAPRTVRTRVRVENELARIMKFTREEAVRRNVDLLNAEIREANRGDLGPLQPQELLDADRVVAAWRARRR